MNQFTVIDRRVFQGGTVQRTVRHVTGINCQLVHLSGIDTVVRKGRFVEVQSVHIADIDTIVFQHVIRALNRTDIRQDYRIALIHPGGWLNRP